MPTAEPIALPSTWRGPELKVTTGRVAKYRRELANLRDSTPPVDRWLEAAAIADEAFPLRDVDGREPARVPRREDFATVRRRGRAVRA